MPTIPFAAVSDVYSDWNFDKPNTNTHNAQSRMQSQPQPYNQSQPQPYNRENRPQLQSIQHSNKSQEEDNLNTYDSSETQNDIRSFCPNCKNSLKANDILQQRIIEQNIWPRPRYVPQYPQAYVPYDPYNRYWAQNQPASQREDFGNGLGFGNGFGNMFEGFGNAVGSNKTSPENLLQILLLILIALFIIQLVELVYSKCE